MTSTLTAGTLGWTPTASAARAAELLDTITDTGLSCAGQRARAEIISSLVHQIYDAVAWLSGDADDEELVALRFVVDAANAYYQRLDEPGHDAGQPSWMATVGLG